MAQTNKITKTISRVIIAVVVTCLLSLVAVIAYNFISNTNNRKEVASRRIQMYDSLSSLPFIELNLSITDSASKASIVDSFLKSDKNIKVYANVCNHPRGRYVKSTGNMFVSKIYQKYFGVLSLYPGVEMIIHGKNDLFKHAGPYMVIFPDSTNHGIRSNFTINSMDFNFHKEMCHDSVKNQSK